MTIHSNASLVPDVLPGLSHRTLAGPEHGLRQMEVWSQSVAPQGATPPHRHDCEEVVVVTAGQGVLAMGGREHAFAAGDTVVIPRNADHQILNTGDGPLTLIASFAMSPVRVELPDGTPLDLPWHQPAFQQAQLA